MDFVGRQRRPLQEGLRDHPRAPTAQRGRRGADTAYPWPARYSAHGRIDAVDPVNPWTSRTPTRPRGDPESPWATKGSALGLTVTGGLQRKLDGGQGAAIVSRTSTPDQRARARLGHSCRTPSRSSIRDVPHPRGPRMRNTSEWPRTGQDQKQQLRVRATRVRRVRGRWPDCSTGS